MKQNLLNIIPTLFKIFFGIGLFSWLYYQGSIDFSYFNSGMVNLIIISICIQFLSIYFMTWRWRFFLKVEEENKQSILKLYPILWTSLFFSVFIPGKLSELSIVYYTNKKFPSLKKSYLLLALFFDNVFGFLGLLLIGYCGVILYAFEGDITSGIFTLFTFILIFFFVACYLMLYSNKFQDFVTKLSGRIPFFGKYLEKFMSNFEILKRGKKEFLGILFVSTMSSFLRVFFFFILLYGTGAQYFNLQTFSIIPFGFIFSSLISSNSIGVGNVIFDQLFQVFSLNDGGSIFNLFLFSNLIVALSGIIPWIFVKISYKNQRN